MKRPPEVKVPAKDIKPGQIYRGYETVNGDSTTVHFCEVVISQNGTPLVWGKNPIEEEVSCFTRRMTWDEERDWMKSQIDLTSEKDWIDDMREDTLSIYNKMMEENAPLFGDIWEG